MGVRLARGVGEGVAAPDGDADAEGDPDDVALVERLPVADWLGDADELAAPDVDCEGDVVWVGVHDTLGESDGETDRVTVPLGDHEGVWVLDRVIVREGVSVLDLVPLWVLVPERVRLALGVPVRLGVRVGDSDAAWEAVEEPLADGDPESEAVALCDGEAVAEREPDRLGVDEGLAVPDLLADSERDVVCESETERVCERVRESVWLFVEERDGVRVGVGTGLSDRLCVWEADSLPLCVSLWLAEDVTLGVPEWLAERD